MRQPQNLRLALLLPTLAAACGLLLLAWEPAALQTFRNGLFDQYQRGSPRPFQTAPVRIIDIDEASLARLGQWPWPRTRLAELVDRLADAGAAAIGFDIVFAEPDRTSPRAIADLWSLDASMRDALAALPDHDDVFARSIARAPVVLAFALDRSSPEQTPPQSTAPRARFVAVGDDPARGLPDFSNVTASLPALLQPAAGNGAMTFLPDNDGIVRRVPLALQYRHQPQPTLVTELLRVGQGEQNLFLKAADGKPGALAGLRVGAIDIPTTPDGEIWVHYTEAVKERYLPAWKVLADQVPHSLIDGHLVLVGTSAPGLMDLRFGALGRILPGVEIHAQALEQILLGHTLERPSWAKGAEALILLAGTWLIGFLSLRAKALPAALFGAAICTLTALGGWFAFRTAGLLIDTLTPGLVFIVTFGVCSLVHHWVSERQQRWIKAAFSRYVSPNRVSHLIEHPADVSLGGRRQRCSFVFTDLAGFTRLMEQIDPGDAVALLNEYIDRMIAIAFRHDGTLDRIVGDAVAIMFSAPVVQADHAARALACAIEMDAFGSDYAESLRARGIEFGITRIGVHTGEVIVGNFGGSTIIDYRALGDAVNTASRLEGANKTLGTHLCVSGATLAGCSPEPPARPVGQLVLKGKTQSLPVFEPLTPRNAATRAPAADYRAAYEQMANDDALAIAAFQTLAARYPDDPLVALHVKRLTEGAHGDRIVMTEK